MNLIIVESPTKAKTLSRFLGDGYIVEATMGHLKDLPKSKLGVDVENNFAPTYDVVPKKLDQIKKILTAYKKADKVYLASDPDREGEAISSHVYEILKESPAKKELDGRVFRIVFHEITKEAVESAIGHPRDVDNNLVDAQIARRVLDRLVGYNLSPVLWKKVRRGLSAGRVQSVCVRLIVEREKEIAAFVPVEYWEIGSDVSAKSGNFFASLSKIDGGKAVVSDEKTAQKIVADLEKSKYSVLKVSKREVKNHPYAPFTTSTMTQAAARMFGWSAKRTMSVAQALYEEGAITYHRTDSVYLAASAVTRIREYIQNEYGKAYLPEKPRFFKVSSKVAQEAHEAIRPVGLDPVYGGGGKMATDMAKLYSLVWRRFVSCQMSSMISDETTIEVSAKGASEYLLRVSGRVIRFDGFRRVYGGVDVDDKVILPEVLEGEELSLNKVVSEQKFTQPPARYNEASLIKTLEKLGIGRPSTYAPTITTIQLRGYVEKDEGKFLPTPVGTTVNEFLMVNFPNIVDYSFTASMEDALDKVANGELSWTSEIKQFWTPFNSKVEEVTKNAERVKIPTQSLGKPCPECGEGELVVRSGRFGKFISCSRFPDCKHTEKLVVKIDIKCPKCDEGDVVVKKTKRGRKFFGCSRYPDCDFASWKKPQDPNAPVVEESDEESSE